MSADEINIVSLTYIKNGQTYEGKIIEKDKLAELGLTDDCNCGDERCNNGYVIRCMAGGGKCVWYQTGEVCP